MSRRSFITRTTALAAFSSMEISNDTASWSQITSKSGKRTYKIPPTTLHGYGMISGDIQYQNHGRFSVTHLICESVRKALLTQAKYLSDLERITGLETKTIVHKSTPIRYKRTPSGGAAVCMARGREVFILSVNEEKGMGRLCAAYMPGNIRQEEFQPSERVPMYLDRWDRFGLLFYMATDAAPPGAHDQDQTYDYSDVFKFAHNNGPAGLVFWANPLQDDHSEGLTNEQSWGWVQENARRKGIPIHINTQISPPQLWLANRFREQTMLKSPQFLGGYYGVAHDSASVGALSWLSQEGWDAQFGIYQHIVKKYANDANIVGWLEPHGETGETPQKFFLEYGAYADEAWRDFMRGRYKTLRALSQRWYGDPVQLKTWAELHAPEVAEFAGLDASAIDLRGTWRVKYVPAPDGHVFTSDEARSLPSPPPVTQVPFEWYQPGFDDTGWDELIAPGNDRMLYMTRSPLIYRRTINIPADWLAHDLQAALTIWDLVNRDHDETAVYVNGRKMKEQPHLANDQHWSQFDLSGVLHAGTNTLALQMPRAIICYRAYLSKGKPLTYPQLGVHRNAQWVDFIEWNTQSRGDQIRRGAEMIRQVDEDSSINFMAPYDYYDPIKKACQDYGGRFHDTGAMAGFWTEWNTLMMSGSGLPVTAEAGNGAPNPRELQMFFGRWLTEGVNGVHYFQSWGEIAWNPEVLKAFEANLPMYRMIGKYHSPFARVATLYSMQNDYLTGFPWQSDNDESRGGVYSLYNSAGQLINYCPRDGVGAADFGAPLVDKYRVIIDSNSSYMSEELIANIEKYVRRGGIFITFGETGRHTPVEPDSWPISKLTGYKVLRLFGWGDGKSLSAASGQRILTSMDLPSGIRALGLSLTPAATECRALAMWDDGSVAIGMRPLGKGWAIHLGPQIRDEQFVSVVGAIMRHFGVNDRVPAVVKGRPGLHMRHFISNSGLHDVWIVFNESDDPHTTDLTFLPGVHPDSLTDIVSGQKMEITRDPAGDYVGGIELAKWQSRMFLSPRADVAASTLEWITLQRGWWQGTLKPPRKHLPTPAEQQRFSMDLTEGWRYKNAAGLSDEEISALAQPGVDDSKWQRRQLDLWLSPGDEKPKRHLLRRKFTIPANWTDGEIVLCADIPGAQFSYETRVFLDGAAWSDGRKLLDGPYFDSFAGRLRPGTTHLLALDIQGNSTLTGSRGPMWLYYLPNPKERQSLSGAWMAYSDALQKTGECLIPGLVKGMYFSRSVMIDIAHKGQNVVIHIEASGDRFSILINGHRLNSAGLWRGRSFQFNITPMVFFGDVNLIEIAGSPGEKTISLVEIRYYEKGMFP